MDVLRINIREFSTIILLHDLVQFALLRSDWTKMNEWMKKKLCEKLTSTGFNSVGSFLTACNVNPCILFLFWEWDAFSHYQTFFFDMLNLTAFWSGPLASGFVSPLCKVVSVPLSTGRPLLELLSVNDTALSSNFLTVHSPLWVCRWQGHIDPVVERR